ncbi:hypothetical protein NQZ68_026489 [Dissostichus eleginoides]|nr:hypothetical protein NQZ68_026489 [Dissostichus eleginoides]
MQRAYEFLLTKAEQPQTLIREQQERPATEQQPQTVIREQQESPATEQQPQTVIREQQESPATEQQQQTLIREQQESPATEQQQETLSREQQESHFILNLVPCSTSLSSSSSQSGILPPHAISQSSLNEQPKKKMKPDGCHKCRRQKVFKFDKITGRRVNKAGKAECKVCWLPCSMCCRTWEDTWEPASEFEHHTASLDSSPPSGLASHL